MRRLLAALLPPRADNESGPSGLPVYVFMLIAIVSTVRSCIHLLAPDGGAATIAGMDLTVDGAQGIIFAFALWGGSQLIYALVQLAVAFRYRSLIPLMYLLLVLETLLRMLVGHMKPVSFAHTPPGAVGNYIILPLAVVMLAMTIWSGRSTGK